MDSKELVSAAHKSLAASKASMANGDSDKLARFVRLSTMQVELNGSVSAALGMEMIAYIRQLEKIAIPQ